MDFYFGGRGALDLFLDKIESDAAKIEKKLVNVLCKTVQLAARIDPNIRVTFFVDNADVTLPPDEHGNFLPKSLAITSMAAASDINVLDDGRLCVGGFADPLNGDVTVTITGPSGNSWQEVGTVDGITCRWSVWFTTVEESGYLVQASQALNGGYQSPVRPIGVP